MHIAEVKTAMGNWVQLKNTNFTIPSDAKNIFVYFETTEGTDNFYIDEVIMAKQGTIINGPAPVQETTTTVVTTTTKPNNSILFGDITGDGNINNGDLVSISQYLIGDLNLTGNSLLAADVTGDEKIDVADLALMKQYLMGDNVKLGKVTETPIETTKVSETTTTAVQTTKATETTTQAVETKTDPAIYMATVKAAMVETEPSSARSQLSNVNYGSLQKYSYYSNTCKRTRNVNVLLPANYSKDKKYPVLYAMHGYWGNEDSLLDAGDASLKLRQIIGNAIAQKEAKEMIVVFPYIFASATRDTLTGMNDESNAAYDNFINELTNDLMPYIAKNFSIAEGRDNTAITGFSMGGRESLYIGFSRPDLFGYIGAACPASGVAPGLIASNNFKFTDNQKNPYLLMISAGSNDTVVYTTPSGYHDILTSNKVNHIWHYVNNGDHGGGTIRPHIYNFVRALFKA